MNASDGSAWRAYVSYVYEIKPVNIVGEYLGVYVCVCAAGWLYPISIFVRGSLSGCITLFRTVLIIRT